MPKIKIRPLSVNQAWKGRRFKTPLYKQYERDLLWLLPQLKVPAGKLKLSLIIGFSNPAADVDNIAKPFIDILQKKYRFNDRDIYELNMVKKIVKKGAEYICFDITRRTHNGLFFKRIRRNGT